MAQRGSDWGDEVMRGVTMIRRTQPHPLVTQGIAKSGEFSVTPQDLSLLHESIDEITILIDRLTKSNEQLREYLRELAAGEADDVGDDDGMSMAALSSAAAARPSDFHDPEIEDAIKENEFIIKEKQRALTDLRSLLTFAGARCARELRAVPGVSEAIVDVAEPDPAPAQAASSTADTPAPTSMAL
jgi:hypothetical protein